MRTIYGTRDVLTATYGIQEWIIDQTLAAISNVYDTRYPYEARIAADGHVDIISTLLNAQDDAQSLMYGHSGGVPIVINSIMDIPRFTSGVRYHAVTEGMYNVRYRDTSEDGLSQDVMVMIKRGHEKIQCMAIMKEGPMLLFRGQDREGGEAFTLIIHPESIINADVLTTPTMHDEEVGNVMMNPFVLPNTGALSLLDDVDEMYLMSNGVPRRLEGYYQRGFDNVRGHRRPLTPIEGANDIVFRACPAYLNPYYFTDLPDAQFMPPGDGGRYNLSPLTLPCVTLISYMAARHKGIGLNVGGEKVDIIEYIAPLGEHGPKTREAYRKALSTINTDASALVRFSDVTLVLAYYAVLHFQIHGDAPAFIDAVMPEPEYIIRAIIMKAREYYPGLNQDDKLIEFRRLLETTKIGHQSQVESEVVQNVH